MRRSWWGMTRRTTWKRRTNLKPFSVQNKKNYFLCFCLLCFTEIRFFGWLIAVFRWITRGLVCMGLRSNPPSSRHFRLVWISALGLVLMILQSLVLVQDNKYNSSRAETSVELSTSQIDWMQWLMLLPSSCTLAVAQSLPHNLLSNLMVALIDYNCKYITSSSNLMFWLFLGPW